MKKMNKISSLIVSAIIFAVIVAILLATFSADSLKYWFTYSISPKGNDMITVEPVTIMDGWQKEMILNITNNTDNIISDTSFYITVNRKTKLVSTSGWDGMEDFRPIYPHDTIMVKTKIGSGESIYKAMEGLRIRDIDLKTNVKTISFDNSGNIDNTSYLKIIILAALSIIMGIIYLLDIVKNPFLKIIIGIGIMPFILLFIILMIIGGSGGSKSNEGYSYEDDKRKRAAERYKREASSKAGFEAHGNKAEAARAQARMDAAMADMIGGNNKYAAEKYKREASSRAGFEARGNKAEAARAKARMDSAMADMLSSKNNK